MGVRFAAVFVSLALNAGLILPIHKGLGFLGGEGGLCVWGGGVGGAMGEKRGKKTRKTGDD